MSNVVHLFSKTAKSSGAAELHLERDGVQLSLPFDAKRILFVVSGNIDVAELEFFHFSAQSSISAIFDLRLSPRLDFVASSRPRALSRLHEYKVLYFDVFGKTGISTFSSAIGERFEILKEIISEVEISLSPSVPCLMLFDNTSLGSEYIKTMQNYFDVHQIDARYIRSLAAEHVRLEM
jgi:hypothetical protein